MLQYLIKSTFLVCVTVLNKLGILLVFFYRGASGERQRVHGPPIPNDGGHGSDDDANLQFSGHQRSGGPLPHPPLLISIQHEGGHDHEVQSEP